MKLLNATILLALTLLSLNCVQQAQPKTIIIKLDMTAVENPSKVGIRGNGPLSWDETTYLSDKDGDGVFENTFNIYTANFDVEFKFVQNDNEYELQDYGNRQIIFEYKPETIIFEAVFNSPEAKITKD